ncbi:MAG: hypothetical protein GTO14_03295 [Anaerolineales bacterium]|nr:hypothetical protein [Anaerolineales bacterium]
MSDELERFEHLKRFHTKRCPICGSSNLSGEEIGYYQCQECEAMFAYHEALPSLSDEGYEPPGEHQEIGD